MRAADRTDYIVRCLIDAAAMYEDGAKTFLAEHDADVRAERDAEIIAWLHKKAREYRSTRSKQHALQGDTVDVMASKIARGAVRANNVATLAADFFQPGHGYTHLDGSDFLCVAITTHPVTGERLAMGWRIEHRIHFLATCGINQWNHEYDGVEPPAEKQAARTQQCGHDDYHDGHEWADQPHIWCPGHTYTEQAAR